MLRYTYTIIVARGRDIVEGDLLAYGEPNLAVF
jgi:hypothetical protein